MTTFNLTSLKAIKTPQVWLAAIGISLAVIHLNMIQRTGGLSFLGHSFLFWCAVASLLWDKRDSLSLKSGMFSSLFAVALLTPILIKSIFLGSSSFSFVALFPIVTAFSLALLASGFNGLRQYWRELLVLFILGGSKVVTFWLTDFDPSLLTAKFASYLLWYSGFPIYRQGGSIYFSSQSQGVDVYAGCSGVETMIHLLSLTVLFFLIFPTKWRTKLFLPIIAVLLGFVINGIRVALLAFLFAHNYQSSFDYWHDGEGSLVFSIFSALMLCGIALLMINKEISNHSALSQGENQ